MNKVFRHAMVKTDRILFFRKRTRSVCCSYNIESYAFFALMAAWAALRRAIGTRNGLQDT